MLEQQGWCHSDGQWLGDGVDPTDNFHSKLWEFVLGCFRCVLAIVKMELYQGVLVRADLKSNHLVTVVVL